METSIYPVCIQYILHQILDLYNVCNSDKFLTTFTYKKINTKPVVRMDKENGQYHVPGYSLLIQYHPLYSNSYC